VLGGTRGRIIPVKLAARGAHLAIGEDEHSTSFQLACADAMGAVFAGGMTTPLTEFDPGIGPLAFLTVAAAPGKTAPLVIAGGQDGRIAVQGPDRVLLAGQGGAIRTALFGDGFFLLASGSDDGTARVWRLADGANLVLPTGSPVLQLAFARSERRLVTLSADGVARRWQYESLMSKGKNCVTTSVGETYCE
jgi:hypothetical protein